MWGVCYALMWGVIRVDGFFLGVWVVTDRWDFCRLRRALPNFIAKYTVVSLCNHLHEKREKE